jgi:hypothetical protein
VNWSRPLFSIAGQGSASQVDDQLRELVEGRYYRIQCELTQARNDFADVSHENLAALRRQGEETVAVNQALLDSLCEHLVATPALAS